MPSLSLKKKEDSIIAGIEDHLRLSRETEKQLVQLVQSVSKENWQSVSELTNQINKLESEADTVHRKLSFQIAEGAFFGGIREDILNLLESIDSVADKTKDASRLLTLGRIIDADALSILRSEDMKNFLAGIDSTVAALQNLIEGLKVNKKTALSRVAAVEEQEEHADTLKLSLLQRLFKDGNHINPVSIIQMRDFIFAADDIADSAENASDVVLVLVAKGYG